LLHFNRTIMKKTFLSIIILFAALITYAQTPARRITATQASVVVDSSGMKYPYVIWLKMAQSGDYWLRPIDPTKDDTGFLLVQYTEEQKNKRFERMARPAESTFFTTGQVIKPFKIKDIDGKKVEAKDWAGKTIVLNFWFIGCPPCRAEIPQLSKLALKYKDDPNVIFIGIALDNDSDVDDFNKKIPFNYRLVGSGGYYASQFKINLYPTNVVIDKEGKVRLHYVSAPANGPYWIDKTIQESKSL
jgi:thiol-disulfide isomerase/thioredoxin